MYFHQWLIMDKKGKTRVSDIEIMQDEEFNLEPVNSSSHSSNVSSDEIQFTLIPTNESIEVSNENLEFSEIISTERNYDRWANFIFPHTKSPDLREIRVKEWDLILPNGKKGTASILITPAKDGRCYTARTYDVYLALVWFWREGGMLNEPFRLSLSQIARKLEMPTSGKNLKAILNELEVLYFTNVSWVLSFQDLSQRHMTTKNQRVLETFNYSTLEERGGLSGQSGVSLQFNENIRVNIRNNITTPVNFTARKAIRSSVAKILYGRIDSILATNNKLERRIENLVEELNLTVSRYQHKSQRKVLGEMLIRNLDGLELSNLNILTVQLAETTDKKDFKLIFKSAPAENKKKEKTIKKLAKKKSINVDLEAVEGIVQEMVAITKATNKNVGLYYTIAKNYPLNLIHRAIGEFKELVDLNPKINNKPAYFTTVVHVVAHRMGEEWIKECGSECRYRPENQFLPE